MNSIWDYKNSTRDTLPQRAKFECPYCKEKLHTLFYDKLKGDNHSSYDNIFCYVCQMCGWWSLHRNIGQWGPPTQYGDKFFGSYKGVTASLKHFDLTDIAMPIAEIRGFILAKYESRFMVNPKLFEQVVGSVFSDLGYDVFVTAYTNDGGIDILLKKDDEIIGVQVKRYRNKIKISQIRELLGALTLKNLTKGIFVTTSEFEKGAYQIERNINSGEFSIHGIELVDSKNFFDALKLAKRKSYNSKEDFFEGKDIDINSLPSYQTFEGI